MSGRETVYEYLCPGYSGTKKRLEGIYTMIQYMPNAEFNLSRIIESQLESSIGLKSLADNCVDKIDSEKVLDPLYAKFPGASLETVLQALVLHREIPYRLGFIMAQSCRYKAKRASRRFLRGIRNYFLSGWDAFKQDMDVVFDKTWLTIASDLKDQGYEVLPEKSGMNSCKIIRYDFKNRKKIGEC